MSGPDPQIAAPPDQRFGLKPSARSTARAPARCALRGISVTRDDRPVQANLVNAPVELVVLPDCGHTIFRDQPDLAYQVIRDLLQPTNPEHDPDTPHRNQPNPST